MQRHITAVSLYGLLLYDEGENIPQQKKISDKNKMLHDLRNYYVFKRKEKKPNNVPCFLAEVFILSFYDGQSYPK